MRIRSEQDGKVLSNLHKSAFDDPWDAVAFSDLLLSPGAGSACAVDDTGAAVGMILWRCAADEGEIVTLAVNPASRRLGIARSLCAYMVSQMIARGVWRVFLEVDEDNKAAIGLYRGLGFAEIGVRENYYRRADGTASNALLMELQILQEETE